MSNTEQFIQEINTGYSVKGDYFKIGVGILDGQVIPETSINVPLKMMNRHGLIAGATGTGKTKTLQLIAECLSNSGVPVLLMDIKGDLSGLATAGTAEAFIMDRYAKFNESYNPSTYPVELLTLNNDFGAQLRATTEEFGPILLGKILDLNDTQQGLLSILFKYCDDNQLMLLDLKDLIKIIQFAQEEGKNEIEKNYGKISATSLSTILRKIIALQQQGADNIFGEPSFDVNDLMRLDSNGRGYINILRVTNMQDKPAIFSTFMLQMLSELYQTMPEQGDATKPRLVLFIDEAHLLFNEASKELLSQLESTIKLIRSKGVGIFFCTQNPQDVPAAILSQLGMKVQHALRAFTANDRKNIKQTADNYPLSPYYKTDELLTSVGIGEAVITLLNEKGSPTPLVHAFLKTPRSRMDVLTNEEIQQLLQRSSLVFKYNQSIDRISAYEILEQKIHGIQQQQAHEKSIKDSSKKTTTTTKKVNSDKGILETVLNSAAGKQAQRSITRTIFGVLEKTIKNMLK